MHVISSGGRETFYETKVPFVQKSQDIRLEMCNSIVEY